MSTHTWSRFLVGAATILTLGLGAHSATADQVIGNMNVSAEIAQVCNFGNIEPLQFGNYTAGGGAVNSNADFELTCSANGTVQVVISDGSSSTGSGIRNLSNSANLLRYQIFTNDGRTTPWPASEAVSVVGGAIEAVTVYGSVLDTTANRPLRLGSTTTHWS